MYKKQIAIQLLHALCMLLDEINSDRLNRGDDNAIQHSAVYHFESDNLNGVFAVVQRTLDTLDAREYSIVSG